MHALFITARGFFGWRLLPRAAEVSGRARPRSRALNLLTLAGVIHSPPVSSSSSECESSSSSVGSSGAYDAG